MQPVENLIAQQRRRDEPDARPSVTPLGENSDRRRRDRKRDGASAGPSMAAQAAGGDARRSHVAGILLDQLAGAVDHRLAVHVRLRPSRRSRCRSSAPRRRARARICSSVSTMMLLPAACAASSPGRIVFLHRPAGEGREFEPRIVVDNRLAGRRAGRRSAPCSSRRRRSRCRSGRSRSSVWLCTSSATRSDVVTSHGITVASMTPFDSASGTAGTGIPTVVAPRLVNSMVRHPGRRPQLDAVEVGRLGHRVVGMDHAGAVDPEAEDVDVREDRCPSGPLLGEAASRRG